MDVGPGDHVICVDNSPRGRGAERHLAALAQLVVGRQYTVRGWAQSGGILLAELVAPDEALGYGWFRSRFRKVQRRDLSEWLETSTDFEEPKRTPTPAKPSKVMA